MDVLKDSWLLDRRWTSPWVEPDSRIGPDWLRLRLLDVTEDGRFWLSEDEPPAAQSTSSMFTPLLQLQ
ncbi:hypothetical protein EYF80_010329 [Liparis tanakae]|uniref:Uncharacterized protein n=1 Tax=Liparis tanakae TaxID=230148 RepID=A0A4Z2IQL4_9TELE|nr:hypothetical protein EYF80_010329 [Liparis tanakae]